MGAFLGCLVGGAAGLALGTVLGFGAALAVAAVLPNPDDGTFAMRQLVVCLPLGAIVGLVAGIAWGLHR
jgi:hypothetical protein